MAAKMNASGEARRVASTAGRLRLMPPFWNSAVGSNESTTPV